MSELFRSQIVSYPRTRHLEDSRLQPGDQGMGGVPFAALSSAEVVYEEKVDGANAAFRFDGAGELYGQSRGHYLNLSDKSVHLERGFNLFKDWLRFHRDEFLARFEDRYIVYGEWLGVTHTVFYDRLPHLFLEFDIYDLVEACFLDTPRRRELCAGLPIAAVPVLYRGRARDLTHLKSLVGPSCFKTPASVGSWAVNLARACKLVGDDVSARQVKLDPSDLAEGIYIKVERDGHVIDRLKWVRPSFTQAILDADEHWHSRFPVPNLLDAPTDMFPPHLARAEASARSFDSDAPWQWAPWIVARPPAPTAPGWSPR